MLCSFAGGAGRLVPQVPLHRALARAGHRLTLVGRQSAARAAPAEIYTRIVARADQRNQLTSTIAPLAPADIEHELAVIGHHFAGDAALKAAAAARDELAESDLVVCDEVDFGVIAAAQKAGIPVVVVSVIASGALVRPERLTSALEDLGQKLGAAEAIRPRGDFFVIPFAPAMRDPRFAAPADALFMRPDPGPVPRTDGSLVATLGTEFNTESGDLFDRILSALAIVRTPATVAIGQTWSRPGLAPNLLMFESNNTSTSTP